MRNKRVYVYLGKCIQKLRYGKYNQDKLVEGICSKFTLSRIENGNIPSHVKIIDKLLSRLNYYYQDVVDSTILTSHLKHLLAEIEFNNMEEIISDIAKIDILVSRNCHNVLFLDHVILMSFLKTHYLDDKPIEIKPLDLNTLEYHNEYFYTIMISVISENILLHKGVHQFNSFYSTLTKNYSNIILDFFQMLNLQYLGQTIKVNDIFNYRKEELITDRKTYQLIRYRSVLAVGFIEYEPEKAMRHFDKITLVHNRNNQKNYYFYITAVGQSTIYIKNKDYESAYQCIDNCIKQYPQLAIYATPYIILLSFRLNKCIDKRYLNRGKNELCDACINYYYFHSSEISGTAHVQYMAKTFPHLLNSYRLNDPFILLLRKEELYQVDRSHCYKTGVRFYQKLKENCKEVIAL